MYDPTKKKCTRIMIAIITLILLVFYVVEIIYAYKLFSKALPWFLPAGGIPKIYAIVSLGQVVFSGLGALFSLVSFMQYCCRNSSGCCGPTVFPAFIFFITVPILVFAIVPVICTKIKYVIKTEYGSIKDPTECSGIMLAAKEYWYNWAGMNIYRLKDVEEWWQNAEWDDYCRKAATPYMIIAIVSLIVSAFGLVVHFECCCFRNNERDMSQNEDEQNSGNSNPEKPNEIDFNF